MDSAFSAFAGVRRNQNPAAVFRGRAAQGALARAARGIRIIKTGANTEGGKAVLRTFF